MIYRFFSSAGDEFLQQMVLTLTMCNPDISHFENSADSEKPADQDPQCFPLCVPIHAEILEVNWKKNGK